MRPYKGYVIDNDNFKVLYENFVMVVGHVFESSFCHNKLTKEDHGIFEFNTDPTCALAGKNNDWCLVGGDVLILKTWKDNTVREIGYLQYIYDLRAIDAYCVHILTDPWSEDCAIWELTIDLEKLTRPVSLIKLRDFNKYQDKPYTDLVQW